MEAPTAQWVTAPSQAIPTTNRPGPLGAHSLRPPPPIGSSGTSVRPETRDERRETDWKFSRSRSKPKRITDTDIRTNKDNL